MRRVLWESEKTLKTNLKNNVHKRRVLSPLMGYRVREAVPIINVLNIKIL